MAQLVKNSSDYQNLGLTVLQRQLLLKPTTSIFDEYLNIMKSSLQQIGYGMILNVFFYSVANCINVVNEALIYLLNFDAWWQPCLALGVSYFCIQLGLLMYDKIFNSKQNQSISNILLNTTKIILGFMSGLYACKLFDIITQSTGLSFWQYSLLVSGFILIASFVYNSTQYLYNSMQQTSQQYEPCMRNQ